MTKVFFAIMTAVLLLLLAPCAFGAATGEYTLTGDDRVDGDTLELMINIEHSTDILGGEGVIEYDKTLYRLKEITSYLPEGYSLEVNDREDGRLPFMFYGDEHITGSHSLLLLRFLIVREPENDDIVISLEEGILSDGTEDTEYRSYSYTGKLINYVPPPPETDAPVTTPLQTAPSESDSIITNNDTSKVDFDTDKPTAEVSENNTTNKHPEPVTSAPTQNDGKKNAVVIITTVICVILILAAFAVILMKKHHKK